MQGVLYFRHVRALDYIIVTNFAKIRKLDSRFENLEHGPFRPPTIEEQQKSPMAFNLLQVLFRAPNCVSKQ